MKKLIRSPIFYFLILIAVIWVVASFVTRGVGVKKLTYGDFKTKLAHGEISKLVVEHKSETITGTLSDGTKFRSSFLSTSRLDDLLAQHPEVPQDVNPQNQSVWVGILTSFLPFLIIIGIFFFLMQQMQGGGNRVMSFGKAKAKVVTKDQPKITFADVAGADEAVEELEEIKEFLESPAKFQQMGAKIPKGVLLFGPPGTGKTLLARAVAGEAGVPFFSISGSDFVEMFVGVGAARVRDLFEQAKASAPAIVFVDEIDAVGRHRGAGLGGGHDEREQTLNQLLVEMDGFDVRTGVILMAATNRPDILDPALLRPGRFDRQITVDRPDLRGREAILKVHARGKPLAPDVNLDTLARRTPGFTGADLANVVNEAALLAARRGRNDITMDETEEAIDRVLAGPQRKSRVISDKEKLIIAYHESGHALVGWALPNADPVHKVSIISRGRALGWTLSLPVEDRFLVSRSELIDQLAMFLGGRVAEELVFGDPTTGASDDLERATKTARKMVCEWGMSETLGPITLGDKVDQPFLGRDFSAHPDYSDHVAAEIDSEIRRLVDEAHDEAWEILTNYREQLDRMVEVLLDKETIERHEVEEILSGVPKRSARGELISRPRRIKTPLDAAAAAAVAKNGDAQDTIEVSRPVVRPRPRPGTDPSPA
ncbi:MAG: peptidase [Actinobacteria bacterium]|nr:peptidase [Actinomycetota bacterium]MEA2500391.1 cell division protease FtsH [Actinomycetota bacterium]MEA2534241.1 cell division protease FtsH [Actinomycetota bacterium]